MTMPDQPADTAPAQGQPAGDPPTDPTGTQPSTEPPQGDIDWKAMSRKWEKQAKANSDAAAELEKLKAANQTDTEKAIAEAEKRGRTAAGLESGKRLARSELKAAAASKGLDLSEISDLISVDQFIDDKGEVDEDAIKKAVAKLAKTMGAKPGPQRGSGQFDGAPGGTAPITEEQLNAMTPAEMTAAYNAGRLKHLM